MSELSNNELALIIIEKLKEDDQLDDDQYKQWKENPEKVLTAWSPDDMYPESM